MIFNISDEKEYLSGEIIETMTQAASSCIANEFAESYYPDIPLEISISMVEADEMHRINLEYRGVDSVTDVLSFPQLDFGAGVDLEVLSKSGAPVFLGDVVICYDKIAEQAEEYGNTLERELIYLFVHSVLHLLGYDHMEEEEKAVMREREEAVMEGLGIV